MAKHAVNPPHPRIGPPASITERLQQAASVLKLCIIANDDEHCEFDFALPLHIVVTLIDEAWTTRLGVEKDQRRPSKAKLRELEFLRGGSTVPPNSTDGKPN
jgi:hypothetical protein